MFARNAGRRGEASPLPLGIEQPDDGKGYVTRICRKAALDCRQHVRLGPHRGQQTGKLAKRAEATLADHPISVLGDDAQHAADIATVVGQRAVGEGVIGFLGIAVALEKEQQPLIPGRLTGAYDSFRARTNIVPDLRPHFGGRTAQRPWMLGAQGHRGVGVVIEEGQFRSPSHPHGEAGRQQHPYDCFQTVWPALRRPQRCG